IRKHQTINIEISSVTSSHQPRNQPSHHTGKPDNLEQSRHRKETVRHREKPAKKMLRESPSPKYITGKTCLRSNGFPEAKT
ncbi:unnamed protein product, partial [Brassica napus]